MFNLKCLHVLIDNVDGVLKVKSSLGHIMKFTYHLLIKNNIDWFGVVIMLKMSALMHGNMS